MEIKISSENILRELIPKDTLLYSRAMESAITLVKNSPNLFLFKR